MIAAKLPLIYRPNNKPLKEIKMCSKKYTPAPHPHAELIIEWVKDTKRKIEISFDNINWSASIAPPIWSKDAYYRFADTANPK